MSMASRRLSSQRVIVFRSLLPSCQGQISLVPNLGMNVPNWGMWLKTARELTRIEKRVLEYVSAVVVQVGVLLSGELADTHASVNAPRVQELLSDFRDNHKFLAA